MASFTYAQLVQALQDWPEDDDDSAGGYVENIPRIIALGETRLVRDLNLELFDYTEDLLATDGDRLVAKPDEMIVPRTLELIDGDGVSTFLQLRSYAFCKRYAPDPLMEGTPVYYADYDETTFYLVPTPDDDYSVTCRYVRRPEGLSDANQLTWLSEKAGDCLFAACLMEAEHFLMADDRYDDYKKKYETELLPVARLELRNSIRMGDYSPFKPAAKAAE